MTRGFLKNVLRGGGVCLLSGAVFLFSDVFAAGSGYNVQLTVPNDPILEVKVNTDGTGDTAKASLNVAPASLSSAAFNEKNVTISVSTNNDFGYTLVMSVANRNLTSLENNTISNLASKSGGYTCTPETADTCDFTVNRWGYKINSATRTRAATNYLPVPTSVTLNKWTGTDGSNGIANDPTYLSFGSKVNATQAPGAYSTTITFAATANPDPTPVMQNITTSTLASLMPSSGSTTTGKDERDGTKYTIGKLADGNYWMLDNLALDLTNSTVLNNVTTSNTNASATSLTSLKSGNRAAGNQYATAGVGNLTSGNNYSVPLISTVGQNATAGLAASQSGTGKVGIYYNYCAASAGSYCYGNGTDAGSPSGNATEDICPKGWRIPTGGSSDEYSALLAAYSNSSPAFVNALKTPLSGTFKDGSVGNVNTVGVFWSSTYKTAVNREILLVRGPGVFLRATDNRYSGDSVRCLFDMPTMQSVTSAKLAELMPSNGDTTTLTDKRDGNKYQIMNIGGEYWMNQNLRFIGTVKKDGLSNYSGSDFDITSSGVDFDPNDSSPDAISDQPVATYSDVNYGAWYNYCAVSAGTSCLSDYTANAISQDICPAGWRIPGASEFNGVLNNVDNWDPSSDGVVIAGQQGPDTWFPWFNYAGWWSADVDDGNLPISLIRADTNGYSIESSVIASSSAGLYARCIFKTS